MAEKEYYESEREETSELEETYKKLKELKSITYQFQKLVQRRLDHVGKEIEDIPRKTPKMKTRDKAKEIENVLYDLPDKVECLLESFVMVDKESKNVEEDTQQYKSKQKKRKKGEYNE